MPRVSPAGINHLLKSPFCVHPKTGRVCVPFDPALADDFDPAQVPTVTQVLEEQAAPRDDSHQLSYKRGAMKQPMQVFAQFVSGLEEEVGEKRLAERDSEMTFWKPFGNCLCVEMLGCCISKAIIRDNIFLLGYFTGAVDFNESDVFLNMALASLAFLVRSQKLSKKWILGIGWNIEEKRLSEVVCNVYVNIREFRNNTGNCFWKASWTCGDSDCVSFSCLICALSDGFVFVFFNTVASWSLLKVFYSHFDM